MKGSVQIYYAFRGNGDRKPVRFHLATVDGRDSDAVLQRLTVMGLEVYRQPINVNLDEMAVRDDPDISPKDVIRIAQIHPDQRHVRSIAAAEEGWQKRHMRSAKEKLRQTVGETW